jgi:hypothetical protein
MTVASPTASHWACGSTLFLVSERHGCQRGSDGTTSDCRVGLEAARLPDRRIASSDARPRAAAPRSTQEP